MLVLLVLGGFQTVEPIALATAQICCDEEGRTTGCGDEERPVGCSDDCPDCLCCARASVTEAPTAWPAMLPIVLDSSSIEPNSFDEPDEILHVPLSCA